jgi:PKD repeat protein
LRALQRSVKRALKTPITVSAIPRIDSVIGVNACDLIPVTPITAPGSVRTVPGQTVPVSLSVRNQGGNASSGFTVGVFLSTDSTYSTNDIALGQIRINAGLAANTTIPVSGNFLLPNGIALGGYFVVVTVDLNAETSQTNYVNDTTNGLTIPSVQVLANSAPSVNSPASASVLTAFVEEQIIFNVGAVDVNQDPLAYTWNFGDGTTASGQQVAHSFSSPGTYTVSVLINDNFNGVTSSSVTVTVSALSTLEFAPSKFKLDFKKLNSDSISLALRDDTVFTAADGKVFKISLGQDLLDQTTIARNKGKGIRGGKFTISGNRTLKYSTTKRDLRLTLARYGAINSDVFINVPISIIVEIGTQRFGTQVPFFYVGKKDKNGQGKF